MQVFEGNRPSSSLLFHGSLDAFATGQLLALYEHRTAVQVDLGLRRLSFNNTIDTCLLTP